MRKNFCNICGVTNATIMIPKLGTERCQACIRRSAARCWHHEEFGDRRMRDAKEDVRAFNLVKEP